MKPTELSYEINKRLEIVGIPSYICKSEEIHLVCNIAKEQLYIRLSNELPTQKDINIFLNLPFPSNTQFEFWVKTTDGGGHFRRFILKGNELIEHLQIYIPSLSKTIRIDKKGCVYFMLNEESEIIKIGHSNNAQRRLYEVNCYQASGLKLLGIIPTEKPKILEKEIHEKFSNQNIRGEWFKYTESIKLFIQNHCQDKMSS